MNSQQPVAVRVLSKLNEWTTMSQNNRQKKMADYEVGYKKPPRHSQFKPGNRANPHGRGKRELRTEAEIVNEVMNAPIEYREGRKSKRAPRIELLIKSYGAAAFKGDVGAAATLLKIRAQFERHPDIGPIIIPMSPQDMRAA
jgi:hypothetical protein